MTEILVSDLQAEIEAGWDARDGVGPTTHLLNPSQS